MSARWDRDTGSRRYGRKISTDGQQHREVAEKSNRHSRIVRGFSRDVASLQRTVSICEENFPTALPVLLDVVRGPDRLPADEESQEMLRGKLRILQVDSTEVNALFMELSTHLISINSEENVIFVTFKTFEEIWKFTTYYTLGFLGRCMENLLFDQKFWLSSLEEDIAIEVSIQEDTLNLIYKGILMQEGSLFASCTTNQMFDSSTSGGDLYLEQGDIAQFEPPFLGSGWTVLCLADGGRGTAPKPALEPVIPFYQWFLKSCAESILVGDGKPSCDFPLQFARGTCLATMEYDAEGPDELSMAAGDRINIVGLLVSCFEWFTGRKEATGEVGLVKTSLVKPSADIYDSTDIFLDGEEGTFFSLQEDKVIEETTALLKKKSQNDTGHNYKLDMISNQDSEKKTLFNSSSKVDTEQTDLKINIQRILDQGQDSSADSVVTLEDSAQSTEAKELRPPCFTVHPVVEGNNNTENFIPLFSFLEEQDYKIEFGILYGLSSELLISSTFIGHSDEDELIAFLGVARETARKKQLFWAQTRLCFLLGKLCAGRSKFSQARVYFEEALSVPREGFTDLRLLANIYSKLVAIYLLQKNTESFFAMTERLVALLLGIPDCLDCLEDNTALKYILKKAVLSHNKMAEVRACHLLAKHHWTRDEGVRVIPYLERLLVLCAEVQRPWGISPSHEYLTLGRLYSELRLPHLSISSARRASLQPSTTLTDCLSSMVLGLDNVNRLYGITEQEATIPPQVAPYLRQALSSIKIQGVGSDEHHVLGHRLTVCLSQLFCKHRMVGHSICHMHILINNNPPSQRFPMSVPERNSALIWLAWLHIDNNQPDVALDILDSVLASMPEHCTTPQEGVVLNMRGVALRCIGDLRRATESYQAAVDICQEYEDMPNWAVAQANLGLLCLKAGAKGLAHRHLTEAVQLFSELDEEGHEANFITVLLELGQHYVKQHQMDFGKGCYEWALLLAINANLIDSQLTATKHLCHLYGFESPDQAQCIIYSQHQVQLLNHSGDRVQEGDALEAIGQLYLTLGTERANRMALEYTKSSLGIFIDLGCREKEAYGWLQAGKIYNLVDQTELVDLYVQVAQDVALSTGDTKFILQLLEAAGDIFFNSSQDRDKAITFYRDRALPIAVKSSSVRSRLRLCNKLTELMLSLKLYEEAVEFAQTALDLSITLGEHLNERVANHRLASLYHCLDQYELAEHYYLKTLTLCPTPLLFDEETLYYVRVYQTLGDIIFYDLKDPFDAAGYYHLALAAAMDLGNKRSQLQLCTRLATIYHNFLIDRELSLFFYQKARAFAAELNVRRINISPDQQYSSTSQYKTPGQ
ncbi:SH3 domain and tetratricopeptide repeat-containing protein 1 [Cottoperca gobio]|uniref:SH3 domain and tetratricopeptide repeat-containing protein 1 n=1 Tax=Cottoperca gobio TaxID=56716 RepID=A0A6J2RJ24_COTGO|nr:SH3 domain and tetratricopeptide repeat-containing protein 1 [Cottoperca gobio]XP_029310928.1 SH3 domain and tetratricopeptide repeat-containing protein 1 [Cottoperca gobio]